MNIAIAKEMNDMEDSKIIRMSSKNQVTIPKEFVELLDLGKEVECTLRDGEVIIRRLARVQNEDFSDLILQDLIKQGYEGDELVSKFREKKSGMKSAVSRFVQDAFEYAKQDKRSNEERHQDIFGSRD